jgi:hypothetical protein
MFCVHGHGEYVSLLSVEQGLRKKCLRVLSCVCACGKQSVKMNQFAFQKGRLPVTERAWFTNKRMQASVSVCGSSFNHVQQRSS